MRCATKSDVERAALDALAIGVIVTDRTAAVLYTNATATRLLQRRYGTLRRVGDRLVAASPKRNVALARMIARACDQETAPAAVTGEHLFAAGDHNGSPDAALFIRPIGDVGPSSEACAIIFVREIERQCNLETAAMSLFGLTEMEAKFASAIASGEQLADAAATHGVSVATARAHLSRVFQKTGTRQQSQVAALLRGAQIPVDIEIRVE